jgi:integral membrane sensor domain MASE1
MAGTKAGNETMNLTRHIGLVAGFCLLYFLLARLSDIYNYSEQDIVSFWLPSGVFVGALLTQPTKLWPIYVIAFSLVQLYLEQSFEGAQLLLSLTFCGALAAEALLCGIVVNYFAKNETPLVQQTETFYALVGCTVTVVPLVGLINAYVHSISFEADFLRSWFQWSLGDAVGILTIAAVITTAHRASITELIERRRLTKLIVTAAALILATYAIFSADPERSSALPHLAYLLIPITIFAAYQLGLLGSALASLTLVSTALLTDLATRMAFDSSSTIIHASEQLQSFFVVVVSVSMLICATATQRAHLNKVRLDRNRRTERQIRALTDISKINTLSTAKPDAVFQKLLEICAEVLDVERVGLWQLVDDSRILKCENLYIKSTGEYLQDLELTA